MYYGDEKVRQMGRSILPSTRRKGARDDLNNIRRHNRRKTRQALRVVRHDPEFEANDKVDLLHYPYKEIHMAVDERRGADKIAPFARWAEAITADIPQVDRPAFMKKRLPDDLIGWHAWTHLKWRDHFEHPNETEKWTNRRASWGRSDIPTREEMEAALQAAVEDSRLHRALNCWLASAWKPTRWTIRPAVSRWVKVHNTPDDAPRIDRILKGRTRIYSREVHACVGPKHRLFQGAGDIKTILDDPHHGWGRGGWSGFFSTQEDWDRAYDQFLGWAEMYDWKVPPEKPVWSQNNRRFPNPWQHIEVTHALRDYTDRWKKNRHNIGLLTSELLRTHPRRDPWDFR